MKRGKMYSRSSNCIRTESTWIDKGFRGWILVQQCVSPPIVPRQIEARLYFFDSFWLFLPLFRLFFDRKRNNNQGEWMTKNANKIDRSWQNFFSLFFVAKKGRLFLYFGQFWTLFVCQNFTRKKFGKISMEKKNCKTFHFAILFVFQVISFFSLMQLCIILRTKKTKLISQVKNTIDSRHWNL